MPERPRAERDATMLGRAVGTLPVVPGAPLRASFRDRARLQEVDLGSGFVPAQIAGRIRGPRRFGRPIAVAVTGRVAAVGRSFPLPRCGPRCGEYFSVMLPEWLLRSGRNDVRVYAVSGPRAAPRLAFLGRT